MRLALFQRPLIPLRQICNEAWLPKWVRSRRLIFWEGSEEGFQKPFAKLGDVKSPLAFPLRLGPRRSIVGGPSQAAWVKKAHWRRPKAMINHQGLVALAGQLTEHGLEIVQECRCIPP